MAKLAKSSVSQSIHMLVYNLYLAQQATGGPSIEFRPGRVDMVDESECPPNGRLPEAEHGCGAGVDELGRQEGWENLAVYLREKIFHRMGLSDQGWY